MPHTRSNYNQDQGFSDGIIILGPDELMVSGTTVLTRNAAGDWAYNQAASQAVLYGINVGKAIQRVGVNDRKFLEQFGGTTPSLGAEGQGIYGTDYTGNPEVVRTTKLLKGIKLKGFKVYYTIATLALTVHTCRVDKVTYADGGAPTIAAVLASAANGLTTAVSTGKLVQVDLAAAEQIYRTTDMNELVIEIAATTPATSLYRLYRVELLVEFNYN